MSGISLGLQPALNSRHAEVVASDPDTANLSRMTHAARRDF
jgi:hypothetical protein